MVQGQPGPNMRAASYQAMQSQQQKAQGASSVIMPIYTFGIVAFFVFTIVKIVMKKSAKKAKPLESDPVFVEKVFKQAQTDPKKQLGEPIKSLLKPCRFSANSESSTNKILLFLIFQCAH